MIQDARSYGVSPVNDAVIQLTDACRELIAKIERARAQYEAEHEHDDAT